MFNDLDKPPPRNDATLDQMDNSPDNIHRRTTHRHRAGSGSFDRDLNERDENETTNCQSAVKAFKFLVSIAGILVLIGIDSDICLIGYDVV